MKVFQMILLVGLAAAMVGGCSKSGNSNSPEDASHAGHGDSARVAAAEKLLPATLFVSAAPAGEMPVAKIKTDKLTKGKEVVVTGTIGGRKEPFTDKFATMCIVCEAIQPKDDCGCGEPAWVFGCTAKAELQPHTACVQVADANGAPIKTSLEGVHGLKGGAVVSVKGIIDTNADGGLILNATQIYVHSAKAAHAGHDHTGEGQCPRCEH